jgi:hypothetical protein
MNSVTIVMTIAPFLRKRQANSLMMGDTLKSRAGHYFFRPQSHPNQMVRLSESDHFPILAALFPRTCRIKGILQARLQHIFSIGFIGNNI